MKKKDIISNFIIGCIIGAISFVLLYGIKIIDVTYVDWLKNSGDLTQHYIGWEFFRNDLWSFPIGNINNLAYPLGTSITYMDSIPLFAIFFKVIRNILPTQFQYFGLWGIISFALSGGISSLILGKFIKNRVIVFISSIFFILTPISIFRMYYHTALAGHWIILLSILILVYKDNIKSMYMEITIWSSITALSVLIHPYFTVIIFIILLGYCINNILENKKVKDVILTIIIPIIITGIIFYLIGGFNKQSSPSDGGLGIYSMNINALFNPQGWSKLLSDLPNATDGQYEGLQYLGLGIILMIPISMYILIKHYLNKNNIIKDNIKYIVPAFIIFVISLIVSISPVITFNSKTIVTLQLPQIINNLWSIFRSSGRLFWGVTYIIMFVLIVFICNHIKSDKIKLILMMSLLMLQLFDISDVLYSKHNEFTSQKKYESPLQSEIWDELGDKFEHIAFLPASSIEAYDHFSYYATSNNMTLNSGYIAHGKFDVINEVYDKEIENLKNNNIPNNKIYIIKDKELLYEIISIVNSDIAVVNIDGFDVMFNNSDKLIKLEKYNDVYEYTNDIKVEINSTELQEYLSSIQKLNSQEIILFSVKDEASSAIDKNIQADMKRVGLNKSLIGKYRWSYCGYITSNEVFELLDSKPLEFEIDKGTYINNIKVLNDIVVKSEGSEFGNKSSVVIDNNEYSFNKRGINFIKYDLKLDRVTEIAYFDTHDKHYGYVTNIEPK